MERPSIRAVLEFYGAEIRRNKYACIFDGHPDRTPSCWINETKEYAKCAVCDWHGDAFALVMQKEGCDFPAAVARIEEITGERRRDVRQSTGRGRTRIPLPGGEAWYEKPNYRRLRARSS